jgi:hypothetical protein
MEDVGIFHGNLVCFYPIFVGIWYIFPRFGILYQEKSGNPGCRNALPLQARASRRCLAKAHTRCLKQVCTYSPLEPIME